MEKTWTVVKFTTDNAVEAVPTSWILGQKCYWPAFSKGRLLDSIRKHEGPDTWWPQYEIVTFRNATYDDYVMAQAKAELNSNMKSDTDKILRKLRTKRYISSSDEEDTATILRKPPKMQKVAADTNNDLLDIYSNIVQMKTSSAGNLNVHSCLCCPVHATGESLKQLIKQQVLTRPILNEVLEEIRTLKAEINTNNHPAQEPSDVLGTSDFHSIFLDFEYFPIDSDEKMKSLDEYLESGKKFKAAVNEISKMGGSTLYEFAKRCLTSVITNEYAMEYSWYGAKKKKKFGQLKLAELLQEAADLSGLADNRKSTEEVIRAWLRRAKERHLSSMNNKKEETIQEDQEDVKNILPVFNISEYF